MNGMSISTGKSVNGVAHLRQSIRDILTTPLGSRVMRRDYGSRLFELIDTPINNAAILALFAATAEALAKWEPRFELTHVSLDSVEQGSANLSLQGIYLPDGKQITLNGIVL